METRKEGNDNGKESLIDYTAVDVRVRKDMLDDKVVKGLDEC